MKTNTKQMMEDTLALLNIPSPSGFSEEGVSFIAKRLSDLGFECKKNIKGALVATKRGTDDTKAYTISGHVDTLGAMVKEIKSDGRLKLAQVGGYAWNSIEGENCLIHTAEGKVYTGTILLHQTSVHVYGPKARENARDADNMEVRIDEKIENKEDVEKLGICVGDFVSFEPRARLLPNGYLKSRHLDDKACVGILFGLAEIIHKNNLVLPHTLHFFISNYEEVGHGAAAGIPENTAEFLAVDMAAPGDGQTSDERKVAICAKDSSGPYDYTFKNKLVKLAQKNEIPYVIDIYPFYGSDAGAAIRAGGLFRYGLIGPGVDASHAYERTHEEGMEASVRLCLALVQSEIE